MHGNHALLHARPAGLPPGCVRCAGCSSSAERFRPHSRTTRVLASRGCGEGQGCWSIAAPFPEIDGLVLNTNRVTGYSTEYSFTQPGGGTWRNPLRVYPPPFVRLMPRDAGASRL